MLGIELKRRRSGWLTWVLSGGVAINLTAKM